MDTLVKENKKRKTSKAKSDVEAEVILQAETIKLPKLDLNNKPQINLHPQYEKYGMSLAKQILKQLEQVEEAESMDYDFNAKTYYATYLAGYITLLSMPAKSK